LPAGSRPAPVGACAQSDLPPIGSRPHAPQVSANHAIGDPGASRKPGRRAGAERNGSSSRWLMDCGVHASHHEHVCPIDPKSAKTGL
jgi:hypothetical protein